MEWDLPRHSIQLLARESCEVQRALRLVPDGECLPHRCTSRNRLWRHHGPALSGSRRSSRRFVPPIPQHILGKPRDSPRISSLNGGARLSRTVSIYIVEVPTEENEACWVLRVPTGVTEASRSELVHVGFIPPSMSIFP